MFDKGVLQCAAFEDAGLRCCVTHSCICCAGPVHAQALGWVNDELGERADAAFRQALQAALFRSFLDSATQNGRAPVVLQALTTVSEIEACCAYASTREQLMNLMFGTWSAGPDGEPYLEEPVFVDPWSAWFIQCFCAPCARAQEVHEAMVWRRKLTQQDTFYGNPLACMCVIVDERGIPVGMKRSYKLPKASQGVVPLNIRRA